MSIIKNIAKAIQATQTAEISPATQTDNGETGTEVDKSTLQTLNDAINALAGRLNTMEARLDEAAKRRK